MVAKRVELAASPAQTKQMGGMRVWKFNGAEDNATPDPGPLCDLTSALSDLANLPNGSSHTGSRFVLPPSALCSWCKVLGLSRWWTNTVGQTFPIWWNKPRHSSQVPTTASKQGEWPGFMCQELGDHFGVPGAYHRQTISPTSPVRWGSGAHSASQPHPSQGKGLPYLVIQRRTVSS